MRVNFSRKQIITSLIVIVTISLWFAISPSLPHSPNETTIINQQQRYFTATCPAFNAQPINNPNKVLPSTFSLLNWNIYKQQSVGWDTQLNKWATQVDLITLQEAKYNSTLISFAQQQNLSSLQNVAFQYQQLNYGVNTLSRVPAQQLCGTLYTEPWSRIPKSALASTYPMQGTTDTLLLVNLHAVNFTLTATPLTEQLSPYLTLIKTHQGPMIVTGDFNTWSEARTSAVVKALTELALNEVTFTTDNRLKIFDKPLDHVFYSGLTVTNARSIPTNASDHTPQLVTFQLSN
ncbi:endonuclease/exonuclease/phosphatase family protein [Psychromonas sp. KJ10-2]|uniref:endonuclease/exonuclease/phosphatase family protein n=1 Tax=Psychromonas sp. KJ10-2 TaxID=3391822 RepID=UPI0039B439B9